ncbi:MAG TPA: hypothetical protein EYP14_09750, partial [Planctomycetaceae bacterium]|nr:hypothetical protein [Planctomycetaceae bacterium]
MAVGRQMLWLLAASLMLRAVRAHAADESRPPLGGRAMIRVAADFAHDRRQANGEHVFVLRGNCRIDQGTTHLRAQKAVVWYRTARERHELALYLEGDARMERPGTSLSQPSFFLRLTSKEGVQFEFRRRSSQPASAEDPLLRRAASRRRHLVRDHWEPTQLVVPPDDSQQGVSEIQLPSPKGRYRRIRISPRSVIPFNVYSEKSTATTPPEQITILTGGINLLVDGVGAYGTIDLSADRMVIWTRIADAEQFQQGLETVQPREAPFQVYLEGNIEIRQGLNLLRAQRAFYDARENRALLLDAELKAWIEPLQTNLRVRADRIRQLSEKTFHAQRAWVSASPYGKPGYRLQASDIFLEPRYVPAWTGAAPATFAPLAEAPAVEEVPWVTSLNNAFLIDDFPLLFAPYLTGPAEDPHIPVQSVTFRQDRIFGGQLETVWNAFQLFSLEAPAGVTWNLLTDYRTERGPAIGTSGRYEGTELFGWPGTYRGDGLLYYLYDAGEDNLGLDRRRLPLERYHRGRVLWRHRHDFPFNTTLLAEVGFLSDRNFLEQYYEDEFDEGKDNETLVFLRQHWDHTSWNVLVRPRINAFENTTEWLPRGDFYTLSQPLFGGLITWSSHFSAGYGRLRPAAAPPDPVTDPFALLPYYAAGASGAVLMMRHELDLPLQVGPVHIVPFVLGESDYWSENLTGRDLDRLVGSAGVRGSLMMWRVYPYVSSRILNLNGLAHKMVFDAEFAWTGSSRGLDSVPQYNEFDDNAQERFRQRLLVNTFGGAIPPIFEPRFYAVRTGAGRAVTAPYYELIDDQQVLRLAWRHRLQTKVGPPERLRIKDWMTLDLEASYFPNPARDNFGEPLGLLTARYNWSVGDRTNLVAGAYYDLFDGAPELWDIGILSHRPTRG